MPKVGYKKFMKVWVQDDLASSHGHTESTTTCKTISSERNPKSSLMTPTHQAKKKPTSKWVGQAETQSYHEPSPSSCLVAQSLSDSLRPFEL